MKLYTYPAAALIVLSVVAGIFAASQYLHSYNRESAKASAKGFLRGNNNAEFRIGWPIRPGYLDLYRIDRTNNTVATEPEAFQLKGIKPEGECKSGRDVNFYLVETPRNTGEKINDWLGILCRPKG